MRLVSFTAGGEDRYGLAENGVVTDLTDAFPGVRSIRSLLAGGFDGQRIAAAPGPTRPLHEVALRPVIADPAAKIFCLGFAYAAHRAEMGSGEPGMPFFFLKHSQALVGHGQPLIKPAASDCFDFEGELALVIGRGGRDIGEDRALGHVAGYTLLMDGSMRDWQKDSVTAGKNFERSSALGPWLVTADEIPDPHGLEITTRLNGAVVQQASTDLLLWRIPYLIRYCSRIATLHPGDVISTGTPAGVGHGRTPPLFMQPGDRIEVEIPGIGLLSNPIAAETA